MYRRVIALNGQNNAGLPVSGLRLFGDPFSLPRQSCAYCWLTIQFDKIHCIHDSGLKYSVVPHKPPRGHKQRPILLAAGG